MYLGLGFDKKDRRRKPPEYLSYCRIHSKNNGVKTTRLPLMHLTLQNGVASGKTVLFPRHTPTLSRDRAAASVQKDCGIGAYRNSSHVDQY